MGPSIKYVRASVGREGGGGQSSIHFHSILHAQRGEGKKACNMYLYTTFPDVETCEFLI